jgi:RNA polymerase sigma-54 factor
MKISLDLRNTLSQTLTPQQIQYLKLLQLPVIQLEQHVMQEIEQNPMLDEFGNETYAGDDDNYPPYAEDDSSYSNDESSSYDFDDDYQEKIIDDSADPFEFYKMVAQNDPDSSGRQTHAADDDDDMGQFQIRDFVSIYDSLVQQLQLLPLSEEEKLLGEQIIGNVDTDGYLRHELIDIVFETNVIISESNYEIAGKVRNNKEESVNPARRFAVSDQAKKLVENHNGNENQIETVSHSETEAKSSNLREVTIEDAERVLKMIQNLDPPGIASRTIQECLIAQCKALPQKNAAQKLALEILEKAYDAFTMKHFHLIKKNLDVTEDYIREAMEVIRRLNPKPGGGDMEAFSQSVVPDFIIEKSAETDDLLITVNDSRIPVLKVNDTYEKIKRQAKYKLFNKDTRDWLRNKYEDAKFLIQAIRTRKNTMLKVMTAIAGMQKNYFEIGPAGLRPLIYKDISEVTGLDISTVCRIVNGKYVQSDYGTTELKYFFSEALPNEDGEEVATTVIKQIIKSIIDSESKDKPFSDEKIGSELKKKGYIVARRTIAKYREQLRIPVARLRKEL